MKSNFGLARLDMQCGVPCSPTWAIKSIEFSWSKIGKSGIDKVCVWETADKLASVKRFCPLLLGGQAPASCAFNFDQVI